jgi:hypothetical protein
MNEKWNKAFESRSAVSARATIGVKDLPDTRFVVEAKGVTAVSEHGALHGGHVRYKENQMICDIDVIFKNCDFEVQQPIVSSQNGYSNTLFSALPTLPRSLGTNVASYASISSLSPPRLRSAVPGRT